MANLCRICNKKCIGEYCFQHKPRKAMVAKKRIRPQSDRELEYQEWKETVCRPALIKRDGNKCKCCGRPAYPGEKLDIEHEKNKGSRPDLKRDMKNLRLFCRYPCHDNKTNNRKCQH